MQAMPPRTDFAAMRCPVARTMAVLGERWAILILREAYYGASRFDEFARNLGIAPNILSARLRSLVAHGVLERGAGRRPDYRLTEKGRDFFPAFLALKRWGDRWMTDERGPLILLEERASGRPVEAPPLLAADGAPLTPEMVRVLPGPGAGCTLRQRFPAKDAPDA
jgi:DNA-binding HxlR family transcriptional regulator